MWSRTSSASRLEEKLVKPEKSAKRTVTCLRSEVGSRRFWLLSFKVGLATAWPQAGQNRAAEGNSAAQWAQCGAIPAPQFTQNRAAEALSVPQASQFIIQLEKVPSRNQSAAG